jgi:Nitrous oxidase accessory protein
MLQTGKKIKIRENDAEKWKSIPDKTVYQSNKQLLPQKSSLKIKYIILFLLLPVCISCQKGTESAHENVYVIQNSKFNISNNKTNARATTDGINKALKHAKAEGHSYIKLTPGEYLIQCTGNNRWVPPTDGIIIPDGITLDLTGVKIYIEPNDYETYGILQLEHVSDVTIFGGHLIGDRHQHTYEPNKSHEYGFGINIISSANITIKNMRIEGMTGDGVIITRYGHVTGNSHFCKNIQITECEISDCRRQGISVVDADGVELSRNNIYNIYGTDPQFGIDIEPEVNYGCIARQIKIHHNTIRDCVGGISFHGGTDMEAYENTITGLCLIAVYSQRVRIYKNKVSSPGYISAGKGSEQRPCKDICISTTGELKNDCNTMVNHSIQTGNFNCF